MLSRHWAWPKYHHRIWIEDPDSVHCIIVTECCTEHCAPWSQFSAVLSKRPFSEFCYDHFLIAIPGGGCHACWGSIKMEETRQSAWWHFQKTGTCEGNASVLEIGEKHSVTSFVWKWCLSKVWFAIFWLGSFSRKSLVCWSHLQPYWSQFQALLWNVLICWYFQFAKKCGSRCLSGWGGTAW